MMKFGVFGMPEHFPWENWTLSYDRDIDKIVHAEKMGFEEYWIGEHHSGGYENVPVPEYMIAKASALTHKIKLGTGVISLPFHDPFQVAERLAFLDQLTHGRLICGFGGSGLPSDAALFDIPSEELRPRMMEAIEIIETYLNSNEPVSYKGKFWEYNNPRKIQVRPKQDPLPLAIAGLTGLNSYQVAVEKGLIPLSVYFTPVHTKAGEGVPLSLIDQAKALDDKMREKGRNIQDMRKEWRIVREVYVAESREEAIEDIRKGVKDSYDYLLELGLGALMKTDASITDHDLTLDFMVDNMPWIIGSPDECVQQIKQLEEETGGFGTLLINQRDWVPDDKWYRSMELFARRVMPAFQ